MPKYKYFVATLAIACFTWNVSEVSAAKICLYIFIAKPKRVGSEGANIRRANAAPILVWALLSTRMSDTKCPNNRLSFSTKIIYIK